MAVRVSLPTMTRHTPRKRKRGIQSAAASRLIARVSGILDRPVKPGDDGREFGAGSHLQTYLPILAARCTRAVQKLLPQQTEGAGKAGCPLHPQPRVRSK